MAICVHCTNPVPVLYTVYHTAHNLRLEQCDACKEFADPYVEHDTLLLLMDLILLKRDVFRHLLFNRGTKPRIIDAKGDVTVPREDATEGNRARWTTIIKLGSALVLLDTFIRWSELYPLPPPEFSTARISWSAEATHAFGLMFVSCLTETLAFHGGVVLACFLLLPTARFCHGLFSRSRASKSGTQLQFRLSQVPLTLFYSSLIKLFLLFLLTIWRPTNFPTLTPTPTLSSVLPLPGSGNEVYPPTLPEVEVLLHLPTPSLLQHLTPLPLPPLAYINDASDLSGSPSDPSDEDGGLLSPDDSIVDAITTAASVPTDFSWPSVQRVLINATEWALDVMHQTSETILSKTGHVITRTRERISQLAPPDYLNPITLLISHMYGVAEGTAATVTQWLPHNYDVRQWASLEMIRPALEVFDEDNLDREWVVRNVLGGMAAGFGLRVTLDAHPILTTLVILPGWTLKTLAADSEARAVVLHRARQLWEAMLLKARPLWITITEQSPESVHLLAGQARNAALVTQQRLGPLVEVIVEKVGQVLDDVAQMMGLDDFSFAKGAGRGGRAGNEVQWFAYTGL